MANCAAYPLPPQKRLAHRPQRHDDRGDGPRERVDPRNPQYSRIPPGARTFRGRLAMSQAAWLPAAGFSGSERVVRKFLAALIRIPGRRVICHLKCKDRRWGALFPPRDKSRQALPVSESWVQWRLKDEPWVAIRHARSYRK